MKKNPKDNDETETQILSSTIIPEWSAAREIGYKPITTFWIDFSIADIFGVKAIEDTYQRAFDGWKYNYKYVTELTMVLNHKIWFWYERREDYAMTYDKLWKQSDEWCSSHLKGQELEYYYSILD